MPIEMWLLLPITMVVGSLCALAVCLFALHRAKPGDIVALTRELPDVIAAFQRHRRKR
ncbi:hypothetical protein GT034_09360 [Streptomyces sp. SID2563]|uniref:hypothetical protein n=1 Tax=unclassified Streptomyces TaxID=2593676 RepID=UPI0013705F14|nr:hypothetical protein [Streptomyces sp. SID2563]MYW08551.1 hypothetical protein [Streptomyces sp. SID2563]